MEAIIASKLPNALTSLSNYPNETDPAWLAALFADNGDKDLPPVSVAAVLKQKQTLPGP